MSYNTNTKIPMAQSCSLSDALIESNELWAEKTGLDFTDYNLPNRYMHPVHEKLTYAIALGDRDYVVKFNDSNLADLENAIGKRGFSV
jgi:hypothetical protein